MIYNKAGIRVLIQHELSVQEYPLANFWVRVAVYAKDFSRRMLANGEKPSDRPEPPSKEPISVKFIGCDYYWLARFQAKEERSNENGGMGNHSTIVSVRIYNKNGEIMGHQANKLLFTPSFKFTLNSEAHDAAHDWTKFQIKNV